MGIVFDISLVQQLISVLAGVIVVAIGIAIVFKEKFVENELESRLYKDDLGRGESTVGKILKEESNQGFMEKLEREIKQARMDVTPQIFVVISSVLSLVLVILGGMIFSSALFMPIFAFVGFVVPRIYLKGRREKFIKEFDKEMVKALRRMASSLRVNPSMDLALQEVVKSTIIPEIVKYEFSKVYASYSSGFSLEESFYEIYKNVGSKDTLFLCVAIDIQMSTGGDKASIIEGIANSITEKNLKEERVKSKLAEIDISVKMMAAMPIIFGGLITLLNPDHFEFFTQDLMGQAIGVVLVFAIVGGYFVIKKMSKIEM